MNSFFFFFRFTGLEQQIQEIKESVELPLTHPELYEEMGIRPPKGEPLGSWPCFDVSALMIGTFLQESSSTECPEPARRYWPRLWRIRRLRHSCGLSDPSLSRSTSVTVPSSCASCSGWPRRWPPVSSSLTRSTLSEPSGKLAIDCVGLVAPAGADGGGSFSGTTPTLEESVRSSVPCSSSSTSSTVSTHAVTSR